MFAATTRTIAQVETHGAQSWDILPVGSDRFNELVADNGTAITNLYDAFGVLLASADHVVKIVNERNSRDEIDHLIHAKFETDNVALPAGKTVLVMHTAQHQGESRQSTFRYAYHVQVGENSNVVTYSSLPADKEYEDGDDLYIGRAVGNHVGLSVTRERVFQAKHPIAFGEFAEWYNLPYDVLSNKVDLTKHPLYTAEKKSDVDEATSFGAKSEDSIENLVMVEAFSDAKVNGYIGEIRKTVDDAKTSKLSVLMDMAVMTADFWIDLAELVKKDVVIDNNTGYYDPLAKMGLVGEDGNYLKPGSTVGGVDERSNRRLYIVVIAPGRNLIVHDRYKLTGENTMLVATEPKGSLRPVIGMFPVWCDRNEHDLVMASKLFGFEYDRADNEVYVPFDRQSIAPLFKAIFALKM